MKFLSFLYRERSIAVFLAILAGLVSGAASTGLIAVTTQVLGLGVGNATSRHILVFAVLCVIAAATRVGSSYLLIELGERIIFERRLAMSRGILATPLRKLEEIRGHRLLVALTDDINTISNAVVMLPLICTHTAVVVGGLAFMGWMSPTFFLFFLVLMVAGMLGYRLALNSGVRRFARARQERDALLEHIKALTEAIQELKLNSRRREGFLASLASVARVLRRLNVSAGVIFSASNSSGQFLFFVVIGLLIFLGPQISSVGTEVLVGYIMVLLFIMNPLQIVLNSFPEIFRAGVSLEHLERLGLSLAAPVTSAGPPPRLTAGPPSWTSVELVGVTHSYTHERGERDFTLGPVDMTLRPGELLFLIGGNGSGKTTLAKLLSGLYRPESGEIRFNGEPLSDDKAEQYQEHFSVVFSEAYIFDRLFGLEYPGIDESATYYLDKLQLDHKVKVLDGRLSTTDLSRGQRKRLALLTAYLEDRPICIFDEWAAEQDPIFKKFFYQELLPELRERGKAVVVITHDDQYFHLADRFLKLVDGQLQAA